MPDLDSFAAESIALLPETIREAISAAPLPSLGEGPTDPPLQSLLNSNSPLGGTTLSPAQQQLCLSGLWLLAGDLDRSHTISQDIGSSEGSFWHGIMHRREGDFGNSKYWFRRVGSHPVFEQLADLTGGSYADPYDFVDRCSQAVRSRDESYNECQQDQWKEWQSLLVYCIGPET